MENTAIIEHKPPTRSSHEWEIWNIIEKKGVDDAKVNKTNTSNNITHKMITQTGGCHCGSIRFTCQIPSQVIVWDCNCSDCRLRRNAHIVIPRSQLQYKVTNVVESNDPENVNNNHKQPSAGLREYRWGTGRAKHYFCNICGISPFYIPRSNPDGFAVTFACLDAQDSGDNKIENVEVKRFDGVHWEDFIANEGKSIKGLSDET